MHIPSNLKKKLAKSLESTSPENKRKNVESAIRNIFGCDEFKNPTALLSKGPSDGGIDGVTSVRVQNRNRVVQAALNVKIESSPFNKSQISEFWVDMWREDIPVGIIVSTRGLTRPAKTTKGLINNETDYTIKGIKVENVLGNELLIPGIEIVR